MLTIAMVIATATLCRSQSERTPAIGSAGAGADALQALQAARVFPRLVSTPRSLFVCGGQHNRTYLGCLNCPDTDPESIDNGTGEFGSPLSKVSIRNSRDRLGVAPVDTVPARGMPITRR